jgi:16S rRNA (cytidine1402-2'-O)-methyltransferase
MSMNAACVLYESPFRIVKLLQDIAEIDGERYICIGREMTKIHEEITRGKAQEMLELLSKKNEQIGEFSIYISGNYLK